MTSRRSMPVISAGVLLDRGHESSDLRARPLRLLLAEPDPGRRAMLRAEIEAAGDHALLAQTWHELQGQLSRQAVDAVIITLGLPGAGRLDAARSLRGWPPPVSGLPLFCLHDGSARIQENDWRTAGFDAMLRWPDDLAELPALVRAAVVRLAPVPPLDPAIRAALREQHGAEALAARDLAALGAIGEAMKALRQATEPEVAAAAADGIAAACKGIGALAAAAAAHAAGRDFPAGQQALVNALAAAGSALRFAGRQRR